MITPLAAKAPYDKQVEGLKQQLKRKQAALASFPDLNKKLATQHDELEKKAVVLSEQANKYRMELSTLKNLLDQKQNEQDLRGKW